MDGIVLNVFTINYNARIYCRKKLVFRHLSLHTAPHFMMRLLILKCVCVYISVILELALLRNAKPFLRVEG